MVSVGGAGRCWAWREPAEDVGEDFELTGLELVEEAPLNGGEVRCLRLARAAETVLGEVRFNRAGIFGARFARDEFACLEQVDDP